MTILQRLVRLCADDPVVLAGALPGHLHPSLHLPHVRHQEGRHRLLPLLDHRPPRLRPAPRLHQVHRQKYFLHESASNIELDDLIISCCPVGSKWLL